MLLYFLGGVLILGLIGAGYMGIQSWRERRGYRQQGAERAYLDAVKAGEEAQEAEGEAYRKSRGGMVARYRRRNRR